MTEEKRDFWGVLELMGHVKLGGRITEEEIFGTVMGRIDIPGPGDTMTTQYFSGSAIYRLTPTSEEIARRVATSHQPQPVHIWQPPVRALPEHYPDDDEGF
jgi:hypothetical protein